MSVFDGKAVLTGGRVNCVCMMHNDDLFIRRPDAALELVRVGRLAMVMT